MSKRGSAELLKLLCCLALEQRHVLKVLYVDMTECKSGLALHQQFKPSVCVFNTIPHPYVTTFHRNFQL